MKRFLTFETPAWRMALGCVLALLLMLPALAHAQIGYIDATSGFLKENTFVASGAQTASGASAIIDAGAYQSGILTVAVTAVSGTNPTLDVNFQTCTANSAATCVPMQSVSQFTAIGSQLLQVSGFGRYVRVIWTIGGTATPTFTFSVYGAFKPYTGQAQTNVGDPCAMAGIPKQSAAIAVSSATTAAIVPSVGSKVIYVCGVAVTYTSGTTPTLQFRTGTQTSTACDTGAASLTGVMSIPAAAGQGLIIGAGASSFSTPSGNQLCITSGGTTPNFNGFLTYVQQ